MEGGSANDRYRECLRNHAASLGSYATDGCGEFTPSGTSPTALNCAACGCHRNFHRKYTHSVGGNRDPDMIPEMIEYRGGRNPAESSPELERIGSRKRFRTKFTAEQKEKMLEFAERIGWKMQRREQGTGGGGDDDDDEIQRFCRGVGVSRQVFKVWMHNHKNNNSTSSSSTSLNNSSSTNVNDSSLTH